MSAQKLKEHVLATPKNQLLGIFVITAFSASKANLIITTFNKLGQEVNSGVISEQDFITKFDFYFAGADEKVLTYILDVLQGKTTIVNLANNLQTLYDRIENVDTETYELNKLVQQKLKLVNLSDDQIESIQKTKR
jgi:Ni2+-binding GTPase involved in maturation of urease and hydrogenase